MQLNAITFTAILLASSCTLLLSACGKDSNTISEVEAPIREISVDPQGNPGLLIINPEANFVSGKALAPNVDPTTQSLSIKGWVRVEDNKGVDNTPIITVNQQVATLTAFAFAADCPKVAPHLCFQFEAVLNVDKGEHKIVVTATDTNNKSTVDSVAGVVDYCRIGAADAGIPALFQTNVSVFQNNRCHEIDGCSAYITDNDPLATSDGRNDPLRETNHYRLEGTSTAFGIGEVPPIEYFVHGQESAYALPCNAHDVCYQTANGTTQQQCDDQMLTDMQAVCAHAYPSECPDHLKNQLGICELWEIEKSTCYTFATIYYEGLKAAGSTAYSDRQLEYMFQ